MESWMLSWKEIWAAGWAGDTQDIWYGRTNLKFVQNFTETENNNLQMFPQMKNSVTCGQWTICSIKFRKAVQLKPIKSDKAKICSIKQSLANLPMIKMFSLLLNCLWQISGGVRVISRNSHSSSWAAFPPDPHLIWSQARPTLPRPWSLQWQWWPAYYFLDPGTLVDWPAKEWSRVEIIKFCVLSTRQQEEKYHKNKGKQHLDL